MVVVVVLVFAGFDYEDDEGEVQFRDGVQSAEITPPGSNGWRLLALVQVTRRFPTNIRSIQEIDHFRRISFLHMFYIHMFYISSTMKLGPCFHHVPAAAEFGLGLQSCQRSVGSAVIASK